MLRGLDGFKAHIKGPHAKRQVNGLKMKQQGVQGMGSKSRKLNSYRNPGLAMSNHPVARALPTDYTPVKYRKELSIQLTKIMEGLSTELKLKYGHIYRTEALNRAMKIVDERMRPKPIEFKPEPQRVFVAY